MKQVTVSKAALVARLTENRSKHRQILEEALLGWRAKAVELLQKAYQDALDNKLRRVCVLLERPEDHTSDYDRALEMLAMEVADTVTISREDFASFVQDEWGWRRQFLTSNSQYSGTARALSGGVEEE